ncbi:MAG: hypoxanthine phosphoribosyltransferase [Gammaproteobacteria bacterium]|nr:hypoxanthine phosphoribosyltransferase [Gammaproteobacteria bacterium]
MLDKVFIDAQSLLMDSYRLAAQIEASGFIPNFIVGVWRGGTPVGIAVQEFFEYMGHDTDHISIRTSSYDGMNRQERDVRVHGMDYIIRNINSEDRLLIVDDVFDTGLSVDAIIRHLAERARKNMPETRIATAYYKPTKNRTERIPDYYVHESADWLVFPHELVGMSKEELEQHKPGFLDIVASVRPVVVS